MENAMLLVKFILIISLAIQPLFGNEPASASQSFKTELANMLKREEWREIVELGEKALLENPVPSLRLSIHDQLVSTYFRLGEFEKGLAHAEQLTSLAAESGDITLRINSLYKLSATLRGAELYEQGRKAIQESLIICQGVKNAPLLARVLFNYAALEMDDPHGDLFLATTQLQQAESLFKSLDHEADYLSRTQIRLGKALLLQDNVPQARRVVEDLRTSTLEPRTQMHFLYLEAQVLLKEGSRLFAKQKAQEALALAISLGAKADQKRFEEFLISCLSMQQNP